MLEADLSLEFCLVILPGLVRGDISDLSVLFRLDLLLFLSPGSFSALPSFCPARLRQALYSLLMILQPNSSAGKEILLSSHLLLQVSTATSPFSSSSASSLSTDLLRTASFSCRSSLQLTKVRLIWPDRSLCSPGSGKDGSYIALRPSKVVTFSQGP